MSIPYLIRNPSPIVIPDLIGNPSNILWMLLSPIRPGVLDSSPDFHIEYGTIFIGVRMTIKLTDILFLISAGVPIRL